MCHIVVFSRRRAAFDVTGVRKQRMGDQHRRGRQLRRAGADIRYSESRHRSSQDQREAVGHRQRQLQENTDGEVHALGSVHVSGALTGMRLSAGKHLEKEEDVRGVPPESVYFRWVT